MTKELEKLDARMGKEKRKILLFMDHCAAHPPDIKLKNIEVAFFPANCTSKLQPLDVGIIANMKIFYRRQLTQYLISKVDENGEQPKINVLQVSAKLF